MSAVNRCTGDMTSEELNALPETSMFDERRYEIDESSVERGFITHVDDMGKTHEIKLSSTARLGDAIHVPVAVRCGVGHMCGRCVMAWPDREGDMWSSIILYKEGEPVLCRRRYFL